MRRSLRLVFPFVSAITLLTGCGGSGTNSSSPGSTTETTVEVTAPKWTEAHFREPGPHSPAVIATSDYAVGEKRVTFILPRKDQSLIRVPLADVYYQPVSGGKTIRTLAKLTPIGVRAGAGSSEIEDMYVVRLDLTRPGQHWIVIEPRGVRFQGFQILDVKAEPAGVGLGEQAPASANPTTSSHPAEAISTGRPPNKALLRYSVADSLKNGVPFVVVFATPAYCETRTCGPALEVVERARVAYEKQGVRFIHIEVYEDNIPGKGPNQWMREWRLPTEPWIFVVDRGGVVRDRFGGPVAVSELTDSIRRNLLN